MSGPDVKRGIHLTLEDADTSPPSPVYSCPDVHLCRMFGSVVEDTCVKSYNGGRYMMCLQGTMLLAGNQTM